jgi:GH43 family beta-xylosidase
LRAVFVMEAVWACTNVNSDWNNAESRTIFTAAPGLNYSTDIWAPELHSLDDAWYLIFTADPRNDAPPPEVDM